jgi:L-ascorbate metabolism protein UlaG (beta-lactamase superfamily)
MPNRLRWLGHAALLLQTDRHSIVIDPFLSDNPAAACTAKELNPNFILVSHGHSDHLGDTIEMAKRTDALVIANYEICNWLENKGLKKVHGLQLGGSHGFPFGKLKLTVAFHGSALPDGSYGGNPCGFLIELAGGKKIYDAADTGLFGDMKLIGEEGIDLAILPIGDNYTMGPDDAIRALKLIQPKRTLPIHFNTWPLIEQDAKSWAERVRKETKVTPIVLKPGEWVDI